VFQSTIWPFACKFKKTENSVMVEVLTSTSPVQIYSITATAVRSDHLRQKLQTFFSEQQHAFTDLLLLFLTPKEE
jgi:hypothetical protein